MPFRARLAAGLAAALLAPSLAFADAAPACPGRDLTQDPSVKLDIAAFADALANDSGLLWKIEKDGVAPSYLYGTIHSTQPGPVALAREASHYLEGARSVVTELGGPFDAAQKVEMSADMLAAALSPDVDTFAGVFTPDEAALTDRYLTARGYPKEMAHHLKLWFLAVAADVPDCEQEGEARALPEVDEMLAELGRAKGLPVIALETIKEQTAALAETSASLAARMLLATARAPEAEDDAYATLLALYREKRPALALAYDDAAPGLLPEDRAAEREFTRLLLIGRNETMAARAAPYLAAGGAFVAVGALHLAGKDGLIERFRALGYRVRPVW